LLRLCAAALLLTLLGACGILNPTKEAQPSFYSLDGTQSEARPKKPVHGPISTTEPTLIVNPPHAAAGFDSHRIVYVREPHQLEYFAHSEWADSPARMIAPLIVTALERSGAFRAVVLTPSAAAGDLRLDVEIVRLQHEFGSSPSRVHLTLRAYMVDNETRQVLAWREFDVSQAAAQDNPYAGVVAANTAVQNLTEQLADFCAQAATKWQLTAATRLKTGE
jgi:cholesterol transport system auxiliary component